jgi:hypothetical protein
MEEQRPERPRAGARAPVEQPGLLACGMHDAHPAMQRLQPVAANRHRGVGRCQPRLNETTAMHQIARAPVRIPLRIQCPGPVGPASVSATTALPTAEALRRPSADTEKTTPQARHRSSRSCHRHETTTPGPDPATTSRPPPAAPRRRSPATAKVGNRSSTVGQDVGADDGEQSRCQCDPGRDLQVAQHR